MEAMESYTFGYMSTVKTIYVTMLRSSQIIDVNCEYGNSLYDRWKQIKIAFLLTVHPYII